MNRRQTSAQGALRASRRGKRVLLCGIAILVGAAMAMRAIEAAFAGVPAKAALQGVLAAIAFLGAAKVWMDLKRDAEAQVAREIITGRRNPDGSLRSDDEDDNA